MFNKDILIQCMRFQFKEQYMKLAPHNIINKKEV